MKNVTLAIDDTLLEQARGLAERRKTSLNALMRSLLSHEVEHENRITAARLGLIELMENSTGTMKRGAAWKRQDIYDEREARLLPGHQRPDLRGDGEDE